MVTDRLFVNPPVENVRNGDGFFLGKNFPVNLFNCTSFVKGTSSVKDSELQVPVIIFHYLDDKTHSWCFPTEERRDDTFERLKRVYSLTSY